MTVAVARPELIVEDNTEDEAPRPYTAEQFRALAAAYPDLRMEMTKEGEIVIMPPAFSETGRKNFRIATQLGGWAEQDGTGEGFDSSAGFTLPSGAERSPDAAWIVKSRWETLPAAQKNNFAPISPDFVIELRSETDRLSTLQTKMREYVANGVRLGWLIDPRRRKVEVYRPERGVEVLDNPDSISGEGVLPGFTLDLTKIWD